jgi:hypothetical protein
MPWQRPTDRATGFRDGLLIPALPKPLRWCPTEPDRYEQWWNEVYDYRKRARKAALGDRTIQRQLRHNAAQDHNYFLCVYGVIKEPRNRAGLPGGFRPFIPLPFQVELGHWRRYVLARNGDPDAGPVEPEANGLVEKARDMGVTWYFVSATGHAWLFRTGYKAGYSSYNADLVDIIGSDDGMFTKLRVTLGIEEGMDDDERLPDYLMPASYRNKLRLLKNNVNGNEVRGYTTTSNIARGGRSSEQINDEAASNPHYKRAKGAQQNTTDHIFDLSSANLIDGGSFRDQCRQARQDITAGRSSQSYIRLDWWLNPRHDEQWFWSMKDKMDKVDPHDFAREVLIDYEAGVGDWVYAFMKEREVTYAPYDPAGGQLYCSIDPGFADPAFVVWIQEMPMLPPERRYRVVQAYQCVNKSARFLASVLVGVPITGPNGWTYQDYESAFPIIEWVNTLGHSVRYFGDPYGNNRGGDGEMTYYERLRDESNKLTNGRHVIYVVAPTKRDDQSLGDLRSYHLRMQAANNLLKMTEWNNTPMVAYALKCMGEARFGEGKTNARAPEHDETSHARSAYEHWAVMMDGLGLTEPGYSGANAQPALVDLGGNPIAGAGNNPYGLPDDIRGMYGGGAPAPSLGAGTTGMYPGGYTIVSPDGRPVGRM